MSNGAGGADRGGARLRLLLFSDLLLDRPYPWAPPAVAEARRAAAREALVELLGAARRHGVDVIACAGNLFDRRTVRPGTVQWLAAAFRSASVPVLVAPGDRDFVGPLGGYTLHAWPENVTIFDRDRFTPTEVASGLTIWGAGHTEAHRARSFFDGFSVDRDGINLALFHGAETAGREREPDRDPCAAFDEEAISRAGFAHALVGHYRHPHFGRLHVYPGVPLAHGFGDAMPGGAVLITVTRDGRIERAYLEGTSPPLHHVDVDLSGATSTADVIGRARAAVDGRSGVVRLRLTGRLPPNAVVRRRDFAEVASELLLDWDAEVDVHRDELVEEQTIRGQFVRDVLGSLDLTDERRGRVLLIGLRALGGSDVLECPR